MQREQPKTGRASGVGTKRGRGHLGTVKRREQSLLREWREVLMSPRVGWSATVGTVLALVLSVVAVWTREQPLVGVGQVMWYTWNARVAFASVDEQRTEQEREAARQDQPRVYVADDRYLDDLLQSIQDLPLQLAAAETLERVDDVTRRHFRLSSERMEAIKRQAEVEAYEEWVEKVRRLGAMLRRRPMLDQQSWQSRQEGRSTQMKLVTAQGEELVSRVHEPINLGDAPTLTAEVERLVRIAGLAPGTGDLGPVGESIVHRLTHEPRPTFQFDSARTGRAQQEAAEAVLPVIENIALGQRIFARGDVLNQRQYRIYQQELLEFGKRAGMMTVWLKRLSLVGTVGLLSALLMGYVATFCRTISSSHSRLIWLAALVLMAQALACAGTVFEPRYVTFTAVVPVVLVAVLLSIAYDQRTAMAVGSLTALLTALSVAQPAEVFCVMLVGIGAAVWRLPEIRDRQTLVIMSLWVAGALVAGTVVTGLISRPVGAPTFQQVMRDALLAGFGGLTIGGVTLFVLPLIERAFNISTSLTLIELRDPKQPLLRELQRRAPGTYNHSLNVASISETAADVIGANGLLTYVGALYHDIGKMNKPEYFVENQAGGPSKHDRLSPAMSLLVIVGHVKDGMEIAREYGLPKTLRHFIEAHHGTTLVEYFYHRARALAKEAAGEGRDGTAPAGESEDERLPSEVDYRYPGPKPRTKECAILMMADAVESATRSLAEPTPSRIESLVQALANKRLMDGQFDECDLTFRELHLIVDSLSKSVASIYHGRIVYPAGKGPETRTGEAKTGTRREATA
ncbi:MAG: HDIG domain-containing protein [Phycisphaerales bacterium]|nr:HDIG domain-containing protein [Phycisphaerales bacterium]